MKFIFLSVAGLFLCVSHVNAANNVRVVPSGVVCGTGTTLSNAQASLHHKIHNGPDVSIPAKTYRSNGTSISIFKVKKPIEVISITHTARNHSVSDSLCALIKTVPKNNSAQTPPYRAHNR